MKKILTILFFLQFCFSLKSQDWGTFIGKTKANIKELKKPFNNYVTGDFYKLAYTLDDPESAIKAIIFNFDTNTPNEFTTCETVIIFVKSGEQSAIMKLKSDFPYFDSKKQIYYNDKHGAEILEQDPESPHLIRVMYFNL